MSTSCLGANHTWPMPPGSGPCQTWPLDLTCLCPGWSTTPAEWTPAQRSAVEIATELLWRHTAGKFGVCHRLVRPCRRPCPQTPGRRGASGLDPAIVDGVWINLGCGCGCPPERCDDCDCGTGPDQILVPGPIFAPLTAPGVADPTFPVEVFLDGQLLEPDQYWVQAPNRIVRTDGHRWPQCQDMSAPHDSAGAFAISYWIGTPVPVGGRRAVARLACEIAKACAGDDSCALPQRVQTVVREGITYTMLDPMQHLDQGRTGITEVDMWLAAVNPTNIRGPATVWSPDQAKVRRQGVRPWR